MRKRAAVSAGDCDASPPPAKRLRGDREEEEREAATLAATKNELSDVKKNVKNC